MMKYKYSITLLSIYQWILLGLYLLSPIDSISQINDTTRIDNLNDEAWQLCESNPTQAIILSLHAVALADSIHDDYRKSISYVQTGLSYETKGSLDTALIYYFKGLKIQEKLNAKLLIASTVHNIGALYHTRSWYNEALVYYHRALQLEQQLGRKEGIADTYLNIGIVYKNKEEYQKATPNYIKAKKLYKELGIPKKEATVITQIANTYAKQKDYVQAIALCELALDSFQKYPYLPMEIVVHNILAPSYLAQQNLPKALQHALLSIELCKKSDQKNKMQYAYLLASDIYTSMDSLALALFYYKEYAKLAIEFANTDTRLLEVASKYEIEKKNKELVQSKLEQETERTTRQQKELKLQAETSRRNILIGLLALILLATWFFYHRFILHKKLSKELTEKNKTISQALKEREVLLGEVHHRVKNNLQLISSILQLQAVFLEDAKAKSAIRDTQKRVDSMAIIHQKLYQQEEFDGIQLQEYIPQLMEEIDDAYFDIKHKINLEADIDDISLDIHTSITLGLLITELLTNAYKYAFTNLSGGIIRVELKDHQNYLSLLVKDNGVGISNEKLNNLHQSFGLRLIKSLTTQLDATLEIKSTSGTEIIIFIKSFERYGEKNKNTDFGG